MLAIVWGESWREKNNQTKSSNNSPSLHTPCTPPVRWCGHHVSQRGPLLPWYSPDFKMKELFRSLAEGEKTITQQSNWIKVLSLKNSQTNGSQCNQIKRKGKRKETNNKDKPCTDRVLFCSQSPCHICLHTNNNQWYQTEKEKKSHRRMSGDRGEAG